MTENEINTLDKAIEFCCEKSKNIKLKTEPQTFVNITKWLEEFRVLKEKSVPKKPIRIDECTCPSCGTHNEIIKKRRNTVAFDTVYCWHCGQAIEVKRD